MEDSKAFTFIELIFLIFVVGILTAVAIPLYMNTRPGSASALANDIRTALNSAEHTLYSKSRADKNLKYTCENIKSMVSFSGMSDFRIDCTLEPPSAKATIGDTIFYFRRSPPSSSPARWTRMP